MNSLVFIDESLQEKVFPLLQERITVGTAEGNTLLLAHPSVAPKQAEILTFGPEVIVRDLGSVVPTIVNGVALHNEQRQLLAGQVVQFGKVRARLQLDEPRGKDSDASSTCEHREFMRQRSHQSHRESAEDPHFSHASASHASLEKRNPWSLLAALVLLLLILLTAML